MTRRDRHDITVDILKKATSGIRKTELMSAARLSYPKTRQYLNMLLNNGPLEIIEKGKLKQRRKA